MRNRQEKVVSLEKAMELVQDGQILAVGGFLLNDHPMALVREIVRKKVRGLYLVPAPTGGSMESDLLIGAGCVKRVAWTYIGAEWIAATLPNARRAAESGTVEIDEYDEFSLVHALLATIQGLPSYHTKLGIGSDLLKANPSFKVFSDPVDNTVQLVAIPPLRPDVALIHAQQSDVYGNCRLTMPVWDEVIAAASETVIVSVEEIVSTDTIRSDPQRTTIPCHAVDAIVELPGGAHPFSSSGFYAYDEAHMRTYIANAKSADGFAEYLREYIFGVDIPASYLEKVGGASKIMPEMHSNSDSVPTR